MVYPQISNLGPAHPERPSRIGTTTRELDSRTNDGIHVRLLWHPHDARLSVAVHDTKTDEAFALPGARRRPSARRVPPPLRVRSRAPPRYRARLRRPRNVRARVPPPTPDVCG